MHDVGSRLKEIREKCGLTQRALAKMISKSVSAISGYEINAQNPPTDVLISLSNALHVPLTYFVNLSCEDDYSSKGLLSPQKEILDLIFIEFANPSNTGNELSIQQVEIIKKLLLLFSKE